MFFSIQYINSDGLQDVNEKPRISPGLVASLSYQPAKQ